MCDFRNIVGVRFEDGREFRSKPTKHYNSFEDCKKDNPRTDLYHIGMTGCGIFYYENGEFWSDYNDSFKQCEYLTDGYNFPEGFRIETPHN